MTSSNGNIFRFNGLLCGEFTDHRWFPHNGQWRGALMFPLICTWIKAWVNNHEAGDLRLHCAHYDVIVMGPPYIREASARGQVVHPRPQTSLGYLLIYPPQIATVMKPISFCSMHSPVSHTKSLGESREWNMVFQGNIWYHLKAFWKINEFPHFWPHKVYSTLHSKQNYMI